MVFVMRYERIMGCVQVIFSALLFYGYTVLAPLALYFALPEV
jgi:hypothetical protein